MSSEHVGQNGTERPPNPAQGGGTAPSPDSGGKRRGARRRQPPPSGEQRATFGAEDGGIGAAAAVAAGVILTAGEAISAQARGPRAGHDQDHAANTAAPAMQLAGALPLGPSGSADGWAHDGRMSFAGANALGVLALTPPGLPQGARGDVQRAMATGPLGTLMDGLDTDGATSVMLGPWSDLAISQGVGYGHAHGLIGVLGSYVFSVLEAIFGPSAAERAVLSGTDAGQTTSDAVHPWDDQPNLGSESNSYWDDSLASPMLGLPSGTIGTEYFADPIGGTLYGDTTAGSLVFAAGVWTLAPQADLVAQQALVVGVTGNASLVIGADSVVTAQGAALIGAAPGSTGAITVTAGGLLTDSAPGTTSQASLGGVPDGSYGWVGGATADSGSVVVGAAKSATGTLAITGAGASVSLQSHGLVVGGAGGSGTVAVSQGGSLQVGSAGTALPQAITVGGGGALAASGKNTSVAVFGVASVGGAHGGSLAVQDGARFTVSADATGAARLGVGNGGAGTATVDSGGVIDSAGSIVVGASGGTGSLTIGMGGTVEAEAALTIGAGNGGSGSVTVADGGVLAVGGVDAGESGALALGGAPGAEGTLSVAAGGTVTVGGDVALGHDSQITLAAGATFLVGGAGAGGLSTAMQGIVQVAVGHALQGDGTITAAAIRNDGRIIAAGGILTISGAISGGGTLELTAGATLSLQGSLGSAQAIQFASGDAETLVLGTPGDQLDNAISGLGLGDRIELARRTIDGVRITASGTVTIDTADGSYSLTNVTFATNGDTSFVIGYDASTGDDFIAVSASPDAMTAMLLAANTTPPDGLCFLPGTRIATPEGEVAVEALREGDTVRTLSGAIRRIAWLGQGRVLATRGSRSAATPVIVRKGALGPNVPHRDLRVTKGHSLLLDGVLIPVEFLVNHRTILWDDRAQEVRVFHVELDTHDVLIADGAPAESYRDDGNRWLFQNANAGWHLPPKPPCAPVLTGGPVVDAVWRRLLDRAGPRPGMPLTEDPDLHLLADGARIDAVRRDGNSAVFVLRSVPAELRLASRAAAPQELGLARDPRVLGVALRRIEARQGRHLGVLDAADPLLADGFHGYEPAENLRWTNGDSRVPTALFEGQTGPIEITLRLAGQTAYLDEGSVVRAA